MHASGREHRGDARELHRRAQEFLAHRTAVAAVVHRGAGGVGVAERREALAAVDEGGGDDVAVVHAFAFAVDVVVDDGEAVALAQVLREVDVVTERGGEFQHHHVVQAGLVARFEQRVFDHAVCDVRAAFDAAFLHRLAKAAVDDGFGDARLFVAVEAQRFQRAVAAACEREFLARTDVAQRIRIGAVVGELLQIARADALLTEDVAHGLAGTHRDRRPIQIVAGRCVAACCA